MMALGPQFGAMTDGRDRAPEDAALDHLDYLTASRNRLRVLEALVERTAPPWTDAGGVDPRDLQAATDASESTVSRILNGFQDRGWARRSPDGGYVATGRAELLADRLDPLQRSVAALVRLGDAADLLPADELTIDLHHFRDATVRPPKGPQPDDVGMYLAELEAASSTFYSMSYAPPPRSMIDDDDPVLTGEERLVALFPESLWEFMVERRGDRDTFLQAIEAGSEYYTYDGYFPCNLYVFDEAVVIENSQVDGVPDSTVIESRNDVVREWALDVFERYRDRSTAVDREDLLE